MKKIFAADYNSGAHPLVLQAIIDANNSEFEGYGGDELSAQAITMLRDHFGPETDPYLVLTGTAANLLAIDSLVESSESVICLQSAHINIHEAGGHERRGMKLETIPGVDGKIDRSQIEALLRARHKTHMRTPRLLSISEATEAGSLYSLQEVSDAARFAHDNEMLLHIDGARLSNAAAALDCSLRDLTFGAGADVVTFGGTKNGLWIGDAVVFGNRDLARRAVMSRTQIGQLASKLRIVGAQFVAYLTDDLWLHNARRANEAAARLEHGLSQIDGITISRPVQANTVFATMPHEAAIQLQNEFAFYYPFNPQGEARWMTDFATTDEDVDNFAAAVQAAISSIA